ncbi:MAG: hypothetical protein IIU41_04250, partial [Oscillospiraceae bacterium]|nr:hypothetical protein [Oscillospiraceae bacterium]
MKKKKTVYGILRIVSSLVFIFALLVTPICRAGDEPAADTAVPEIETGIREIKKYGNLVLTVSPDTMIGLGFEPGDNLLSQAADITFAVVQERVYYYSADRVVYALHRTSAGPY